MTQLTDEELKQRRREYARKYYEKNKEKMQEQFKRYWAELKADEERYAEYKKKVKEYHQAHKEDLTRNMRKYYEAHREEHLAKMREYNKNRKKKVDKSEEVADN